MAGPGVFWRGGAGPTAVAPAWPTDITPGPHAQSPGPSDTALHTLPRGQDRLSH